MSEAYRAVGWNPLKRRYDAVLGGCLTACLAAFAGIGALTDPNATIETLLIRALGSAAFLLLTLILCIGPLCRLDRRFLPLLYNRRHLGVTMFLVALAHGAFAIVQFHALGDTSPLLSVLIANPRLDSVPQFPFELLGLAALVILFLMAATSHDFWLANLTPPVWKTLHMLVYAAYALVVLHVALGALQADRSVVLAVLVLASVASVLGLHVAAARRERALDDERTGASDDGFVDVCAITDIPESRARIVTLSGERVAVFRWDGRVAAISNVCRHQNGPLGEGRIVDGCVTCPWHGYQYDPATGRAPKPFTEKVPTFRVRIEGERVLVHPRPHAPGTALEPARIAASAPAPTAPEHDAALFVGWAPTLPPAERRVVRRVVPLLAGLAVAAPLTIALARTRLATSAFEYGVVRRFHGVLRAEPVPALYLAQQDGASGAGALPATLLLVAPGKHGADAIAREHDGETVDVAGSLADRDGRTVLEIMPGSVMPRRPDGAIPPVVALGERTLAGEIVDTKCHLGVMNPGDGKTHRGCAARCIAGGIPPALRVRDRDGGEQLFLLVGPRGESIGAALLPFVAEPVEIAGRVERRGDLLVLYADPADVRRLGEEG